MAPHHAQSKHTKKNLTAVVIQSSSNSTRSVLLTRCPFRACINASESKCNTESAKNAGPINKCRVMQKAPRLRHYSFHGCGSISAPQQDQCFAFAKHAVRFTVHEHRKRIWVARVKYMLYPACKRRCPVGAMLLYHFIIPRFLPPLEIVSLS